MRLRQRVVAAAALGGILFAALLVAGYEWDQVFPFPRFLTPYRQGVPDVDREWYLAADKDALDYDVLYHGWWGTPEAMKRADVLFLGNSRAVYGFRPEYFQPYLDRLGLHGYNLSFAGGFDAFPLAIIHKYDLRPKLVIVSSDGFFKGDLSRFGVWATERSSWESWRLYHEYVASWMARKYLHLWLPPWSDYMTDNRYPVWYRSVSTGGVRWVVADDSRNPLTPVPPQPLTADQQRVVDDLVPSQLKNLQSFQAEMRRRGALLVLTVVPYNEHLTFHLTKALAAQTGVPFIDEWPLGLEGQAGTHLNARSSQRFLDALMPRLLADPQVRTHLTGAAHDR